MIIPRYWEQQSIFALYRNPLILHRQKYNKLLVPNGRLVLVWLLFKFCDETITRFKWFYKYTRSVDRIHHAECRYVAK